MAPLPTMVLSLVAGGLDTAFEMGSSVLPPVFWHRCRPCRSMEDEGRIEEDLLHHRSTASGSTVPVLDGGRKPAVMANWARRRQVWQPAFRPRRWSRQSELQDGARITTSNAVRSWG